MSYYTTEALKILQDDLATIESRKNALFMEFISHKCTAEETEEYMKHGFARRLATLARAIQNIFKFLPPNITFIPSQNDRKDAEINLQAFVFHVFGCVDNLARICVYENRIRKPNGKLIPKSQIGFTKKCTVVRKAISSDLLSILKKYDDWLELQSEFRHALAHRIPLYIPPQAVPKKNAEEFTRLDHEISVIRSKMMKSMLDQEAFWKLSGEADQLENAQQKLVRFRPSMLHSFEEKTPEIIFHAQILADFRTVETIAKQVLAEISHTEQIP